MALTSQRGSTHLSYEAGDARTVQRLGDGRWSVVLYFAGAGSIRITCNDVYRHEGLDHLG